VNAGGHIAVASEVVASSGRRPELGELLGSALPDLAAMGRFRLTGAARTPGLAAGIGLHHRTDEQFHRHPWFRQRNRQLTDELAAAGLDRGPAMACSHVGIELLLDGELLRHPAAGDASAAAFAEIASLTVDLVQLVGPADRRRWLTHLDAFARRRLPTDYGDPDAVAHRLHRILAARPRLALAERHITPVAAALARCKPGIDATAGAVVDDLARRLAALSR
jgi:hypothetical protein